jgi:hypothetical protein
MVQTISSLFFVLAGVYSQHNKHSMLKSSNSAITFLSAIVVVVVIIIPALNGGGSCI